MWSLENLSLLTSTSILPRVSQLLSQRCRRLTGSTMIDWLDGDLKFRTSEVPVQILFCLKEKK